MLVHIQYIAYRYFELKQELNSVYVHMILQVHIHKTELNQEDQFNVEDCVYRE